MKPEQLLRKLFPPMLATSADAPPGSDKGWVYELKYDGFRAVCAISDAALAVWSRNELDLAQRFPRIAETLGKLKEKEVVLDGEIVALDEEGRPRFQLLQQSKHEILVVFDILWRNGEDLRRLPYVERRKLLEKVLKRPPKDVRLAEVLEGPGAEALQKAAASGLEGIIAKRATSVYEPRRSREWLKVKAVNEQEFVVVGWTPAKNSEREIGSLHLAVNEGGGLRYAGKVGTGFTAKQRGWWWSELRKDIIPKTEVKNAPRERATTWVTPRHVIQVSFAEWTEDHRLRHPSMLGRREDKGVGEVVREGAAARVAPAVEEVPGGVEEVPGAVEEVPGSVEKVPGSGSRVPGRSRGSRQPGGSRGTRHPVPGPSSRGTRHPVPGTPSRGTRNLEPGTSARSAGEVTLSNPDRLLFPRDTITKEELAAYYAAVAEPMLLALRDRPLSLEHWNQGIDKPSWFHQGLGKEAPAWLRTVETPTRTRSGDTVRHLVADSPEALRWLAQMSVLTVHMWASRAPKLEQPDWIVFDLDPAKGKGIEQAIEAAVIVRGLLEHLELPSVVKTSGKRGIHVFVPLAAGYTHEQANAFAVSIGNALAREVSWITMERALNQRRGRLYLDCMQNAYGKTVVAPYSPRAIDGAPVSAPLEWKEVNKKLDPLKFTIRTMPKRLEKVGDLFAAVFEKRVKLPELE